MGEGSGHSSFWGRRGRLPLEEPRGVGGTPEAGRRGGTDSGAPLSAAPGPAFSLQTEGGANGSTPQNVASVGSRIVCKMGSHTSSVLGDFVVLYIDA